MLLSLLLLKYNQIPYIAYIFSVHYFLFLKYTQSFKLKVLFFSSIDKNIKPKIVSHIFMLKNKKMRFFHTKCGIWKKHFFQ